MIDRGDHRVPAIGRARDSLKRQTYVQADLALAWGLPHRIADTVSQVPMQQSPEAIAAAALHWAAGNGRRPPWRQSAGAYAIALAEILLQKTRGEDVLAIWERLLDAYPVPCQLASAPPESIEKIVAPIGLGQQRTQPLQALARALWVESQGDTVGEFLAVGPLNLVPPRQ